MNLLQMSISGGVFILFIATLRALTLNRLPKTTFTIFWVFAVLRLLLPFSIPSIFSIYTQLDRFSSSIDLAARLPAPSDTASAHLLASAIWLAGTILLGLFFAVLYLRNIRKFKTSLPVESEFIKEWLNEHRLIRPIGVRVSEFASSPITYGVFRPVILLPKSVDLEDRTLTSHILTHEYIHIRRFDAAFKIIFAAVLCIHWFNPLVWMMYFLANRDIELSCDAAVIRLSGFEERASYASSLLDMAEKKSGLLSLNSHFSKNAIEERIKSIVKCRKRSVFSVILALVLIVLGTAVFGTSRYVPTAEVTETLSDIDIKEVILDEKSVSVIYKKYPSGRTEGVSATGFYRIVADPDTEILGFTVVIDGDKGWIVDILDGKSDGAIKGGK